MRRLPRISVRVSAAVLVAALCVAAAVLAATGTFSGSTSHPRLTAEQRAHKAFLAHVKAAQRAARRAAKRAAEKAERNFGPGPRPWEPHRIPGDRYSGAVEIAEKYLGVPYVLGGASPRVGFDTSGLVMYVYAQLGVALPHYTVAQYHYAHSVSVLRSKLKPGDLVFFAGLGHVGIYIGGNQIIDVPHTGAVVSIHSLTGWYSREYYGATRIVGTPVRHYA